MFKRFWFALLAMLVTTGFAFAQVDVNKADQIALDGVKGLGPKTSKSVLEERKNGGDFKDWSDLERRVKGVGAKSAAKLSNAGLTVNGKSRPPGTAVAKGTNASKSAKAKDTATADASAATKKTAK